MTVRNALLLARMDAPSTNEADWHQWYNLIHVANREKLPGFLSARRFEKIEGLPVDYHTPCQAKYLALYDVHSIQVLTGKAYTFVREQEFATPPDSYEHSISKLPKFARLIYRQIYPDDKKYTSSCTRYIFLVGHDVPQNKHREFNAWYNTEHIPDLLSVPGFVAVRRFRLDKKKILPITGNEGVASQYLTIWDLDSQDALTCKEFINRSTSPWTQWVRSWYSRKICTLYKQIYP